MKLLRNLLGPLGHVTAVQIENKNALINQPSQKSQELLSPEKNTFSPSQKVKAGHIQCLPLMSPSYAIAYLPIALKVRGFVQERPYYNYRKSFVDHNHKMY